MVYKSNKIKFRYFPAAASILGFAIILINSLGIGDISSWQEGMLFIIMGTGLMLVGGLLTIKEYFDDEISPQEIANMVTFTLGLFGVIVGIVALPINIFDNLKIAQLEGIKAVISGFAIMMITIQTFIVKRK